MRKKAEQQIRQAASSFGKSKRYRIDKVRKEAGLIRKVFDKTILDMARLGTIELLTNNIDEISAFQTGDLIRRGDTLYAYFSFLDDEKEPEKNESEKMEVMLQGVDREAWQRFEYLCRTREVKKPDQKIREMIRDYIKNSE